MKFADFQQHVRGTLYVRYFPHAVQGMPDYARYYRLSARGITPNGCYLVAPRMTRLLDIDIATGKDITTDPLSHPKEETYDLGTGAVPASTPFERRR